MIENTLPVFFLGVFCQQIEHVLVFVKDEIHLGKNVAEAWQ